MGHITNYRAPGGLQILRGSSREREGRRELGAVKCEEARVEMREE